jgi:hypothetical protein
MAKSLDNILGGYTPKAKGEQEFVAKHEIKVTPDANKNGDDVFKASKVKTVKRSPERHGYDKPQDEKVHEEIMTSADKKKEKKLKAKYDDSGMKSSMQKQYGAEKGKQVYFATIRKQAMEAVEVTEGLKYAQVEPKDVKSVLAAHRATGESARHMGDGKIAYSGKKLVTSQNEAVEVEEEKKGLYYYVNRRKRLGISRPAGHPKAPTAQDFKNAAKTAKESVELDEGVAQDAYNTHHKRAMKAVEDLAKHLMKHKANCDKSDSKWAHSDNLWQMKNMSTQLEDMVHNIASQNEQSAERDKNMIGRI